MAGFSSGDSSFNIKISQSLTSKLITRIQLRFSIGLHIREKELIEYCVKYFNLIEGRYIYLKNNSIALEITNFKDITNVIVPFFIKYPIKGKKNLDFIEFNKVVTMVSNKEHLTQEGIAKILTIKSKMNQ